MGNFSKAHVAHNLATVTQEVYVKHRYGRQGSKWPGYGAKGQTCFEKQLKWRCYHFVGAYKC